MFKELEKVCFMVEPMPSPGISNMKKARHANAEPKAGGMSATGPFDAWPPFSGGQVTCRTVKPWL